ncbi:MAG: sterol desaturase family protein [Marinibacterium sp.]
MYDIHQLLLDSAMNLYAAFKMLLIPALFFLICTIAYRRESWIQDLREGIPESGLNLKIIAFNAVVGMPLVALSLTVFHGWIHRSGLVMFEPSDWAWMPVPLVLFITVFVSDFFNYWRHRLEHTPLFWPAHAVHHSDTHVSWSTSVRWHPINLLTFQGLAGGAMLLMGFPVYALVFNSMLRGYYGFFIHAHLPWTYGKWGKYFVSPAMHRWHHSAEEKAFDKNYAEFFCILDRAFGTYYLPGPCDGPVGVPDEIAPTLRGQLGYAFSPRAYKNLFRKRSEPAPQRAA